MRKDLRTDEIINKMKQMRKEGNSLKSIGEYFGCSSGLVKTLIDEPIIKQDMDYRDVVGKVYNGIEILKRATKEETPWKSHAVPYWAHCLSCNTTWVIRKEYIGKDCPYCKKTGRGHRDALEGQTFGYLTVIKYDGNSYYICKCQCGNIVRVRRAHLLGQGHHHTVSCGCATRSSGEIYTQQAIKTLGYKYKIETIVPECHIYSPFDIEVLTKDNKRLCFFECDGEQHFKVIEHFHMTEEDLIYQQQIDKIKNQWCKENNVPLFRIPYTEYGKIDAKYLLNRFPEFRELLEREESRQKGKNDF